MASAIEQQLLKVRRDAEEREVKRKAEELNLPYLDLSRRSIQAEALKLISKNEAQEAGVVPVEVKGKELALAAGSLSDKVSQITEKLKGDGYETTIYLSSLSGLKEGWQRYDVLPQEKPRITGSVDIKQSHLRELVEKLTSLEAVGREVSVFDFKTLSTSAILEVILAGAIANRVSDIHFEPLEQAVRIRYRLDGVLNDIVKDFNKSFYQSVLSRIKLLAGLKIDQTKRAQDGRISVGFGDRQIELRVSLVPSEFGETAVIRVLDPLAINIPLEDLGLRRDDLDIVLREIKEPNGMILNTGPTGSGKTTTLYAFLKIRHSPEIKIITIEDPIEYNLEGVEQTQVNKERGYDFVNGLGSIMRQDPDVILVGEIRDKETAATAIQAALTGHLVFSTVHANRATGAIPRLLDLEVKATSIGPALNLIMAQRLVRKLCGHCKKPAETGVDLKNKLEGFLIKLPASIDKSSYQNFVIYQAVGCEKCNNRGYLGRVGIFELLVVGREIETLIEKEVSETDLQDFAADPQKGGMVTMQQDGILKVLLGITDFAEVEAATGHLQM